MGGTTTKPSRGAWHWYAGGRAASVPCDTAPRRELGKPPRSRGPTARRWADQTPACARPRRPTARISARAAYLSVGRVPCKLLWCKQNLKGSVISGVRGSKIKEKRRTRKRPPRTPHWVECMPGCQQRGAGWAWTPLVAPLSPCRMDRRSR